MKTRDGQVFLGAPGHEQAYRELRTLHDQIHALAGEHWNWPSVATLSRPTLARILNLNYLYDEMLPLAGSICEFGVHYGSSLAVLLNLRAIKEPHNYSRHIFGFDTFAGFQGTASQDGAQARDGDFRLAQGYEQVLERLLAAHEALSPNSHLRKFTLVKGDATVSVKQWIEQSPHVLVAMAIFDMDIYKPTKSALELIVPRLCKGALLVFDELNAPHFPGETQALLESLDIGGHTIHRSPFLPFCSFIRYGV